MASLLKHFNNRSQVLLIVLLMLLKTCATTLTLSDKKILQKEWTRINVTLMCNRYL